MKDDKKTKTNVDVVKAPPGNNTGIITETTAQVDSVVVSVNAETALSSVPDNVPGCVQANVVQDKQGVPVKTNKKKQVSGQNTGQKTGQSSGQKTRQKTWQTFGLIQKNTGNAEQKSGQSNMKNFGSNKKSKGQNNTAINLVGTLDAAGQKRGESIVLAPNG